MFRALLSLFLSLLLFLSSFVLSVGVGGYSLLYPDAYRGALEKGGIYAQADRMLADYGRGMSLTENASAVIGRLLANSLAYIRGDTEKPDLTIKIDDSSVMQFFEKQAANFTVCGKGEAPFIGDEIKCRPANQSSSQFLEEVLAKKGISAANFSSVDLLPVYDRDGNIMRVRELVSAFRLALLGLAALSVALAVVMTKVSRNRKWAGATLILSGVSVIAAVSYAQSYALSALPQSAGVLGAAASDVMSGVVSRIAFNGGLLALIGVAIIVFSSAKPFLNRKKQ
ncbi:MAG: hypothetical protein HY365_03820 [Candidatus Aenigmarchaeota archaeon]|nr:hypothetical protein [Candidatus Aenigmarchaeota archaeon]